LHEIKHDGYRLIVQREGKGVRLFTRNGYDWTARYPTIVEAALRIRIDSSVIDGEAVLLGVDGISEFVTAAQRRSAALRLRRLGARRRGSTEAPAAPSENEPIQASRQAA
jgi:ATP-dependent DNA ligase